MKPKWLLIIFVLLFFGSELVCAPQQGAEEKSASQPTFIRGPNWDLANFGSGRYQKTFYSGAVNIPFKGGFIPVEDYFNVSFDGKAIKILTINNESCSLTMSYTYTNPFSAAKPTAEISKFRGGWYFTTNTNDATQSMAYTVNCTNLNLGFSDNKLLMNNIAIDFNQALKQQNITTTFDSKKKELTFTSPSGTPTKIDPTVTYNFTTSYPTFAYSKLMLGTCNYSTYWLGGTSWADVSDDSGLLAIDSTWLTTSGGATTACRTQIFSFQLFNESTNNINITSLNWTWIGKTNTNDRSSHPHRIWNATNGWVQCDNYTAFNMNETWSCYNSHPNYPFLVGDMVNSSGWISWQGDMTMGSGGAFFTDFIQLDVSYKQNLTLNLSIPTASSPINVVSGQNITVAFNVWDYSYRPPNKLNSSVSFVNASVGRVAASPRFIAFGQTQTEFSDGFEAWTASTNCPAARGGWDICANGGAGEYVQALATVPYTGSQGLQIWDIDSSDSTYLIECRNLIGYSEVVVNFTYNLSSGSGNNIYLAVNTTSASFAVVWTNNTGPFKWTNVSVNVSSYISSNTCFKWYTSLMEASTDKFCLDDFAVIGKNLSTYSSLGYNGSDWAINLTMPSFSDGAEDFFLNVSVYDGFATYFINATEADALIYPDTSTPRLTLLSPANQSVEPAALGTNTSFFFNTTDGNIVMNCSLIINSTTRTSFENPTESVQQNISWYLNNGDWTWRINCTDNFNNSNVSETRTIIVMHGLTSVLLQNETSENLADTYIYNTTSSNYGGLTYIKIDNKGSQMSYGLFTFNLSKIGTGKIVTNATLYLYMYDNPENVDTWLNVSSHRITSGFSELNVSWPTRPTFNSSRTDRQAFATVPAAWYSWNVTNIITADYADGKTNTSILLNPYEFGGNPINNFMLFYSKEYTTNPTLRPKLNITYYTIDYSAPTITNLTLSQTRQGLGENITITATVTDLQGQGDISSVQAQIFLPNGSMTASSMTASGTTYSANYLSYLNGTYIVNVYASDLEGLSSTTSNTTFYLAAKVYINIYTLLDQYNSSQQTFINITDPPEIVADVSPKKVSLGDNLFITANIDDIYPLASVFVDLGGVETIPLIFNGEAWSAVWLVHGTEIKNYNATVVATNSLGETSSKSVEWSDPVETCSSCSECTSDLTGNTYVALSANINVGKDVTCIAFQNPARIFDCQNFTVTNFLSNKFASGNYKNITIMNCNLKFWPAIYGGAMNNVSFINDNFTDTTVVIDTVSATSGISFSNCNFNRVSRSVYEVTPGDFYSYTSTWSNTKFFNDQVATMFNITTSNKTITLNDKAYFNITFLRPNHAACTNCTWNVTLYPSEPDFSVTNTSNIANGNFTATHLGYYGLYINVSDTDGNNEKRSYIFFVNSTQQNAVTYYMNPTINVTHGQPQRGDNDAAAALLTTPTDNGKGYLYCGDWVQFMPDQLPTSKLLGKIESINLSGWFQATTTAQYGLLRYAHYSNTRELNDSMQNASSPTWRSDVFVPSNWVIERPWDWYWLDFKLVGGGPTWISNTTHISWANITYSHPEILVNKLQGDAKIISFSYLPTNNKNFTLAVEGVGWTNISLQLINTTTLYVPTLDGQVCYSENCTFIQDGRTVNLTLKLSGGIQNLVVGGNTSIYESKIINNDIYNISAFLVLKLQYFNLSSSTWVDERIVYGPNLTRIQPGTTNQIKLDAYWNQKVLTNSLTQNGTYRAYVALLDPYNNTLLDNYNVTLSSYHNFSYTDSCMPPTSGDWIHYCKDNCPDFDLTNKSIYGNLILIGNGSLITRTFTTDLNFFAAPFSANRIDGYYYYQESADSYGASGSWDSTYNYTFSYDSDWSTYGYVLDGNGNVALLDINYSKYKFAQNSSLWQIKMGSTFGTQNLSFPQSCWNQQPLQLRINSSDPGSGFLVAASCFNGSGWQNITSNNAWTGRPIFEEGIQWFVYPQWIELRDNCSVELRGPLTIS